MSLQNLLVEIDNEIDRLNQAKQLLGGNGSTPVTQHGRRTMSVAARKRISMATKARWAKIRASKKQK